VLQVPDRSVAAARALVPPTRRRLAPGPAFWFILPAVATLLLVFAGPLVFAARASFTGWSLVQPGSELDRVGWDNYTDILTSSDYWEAVRVTLTYTFSAVSCELVLGTIFALMLNLPFFWRGAIRSLMMIPMVMTPAVIGIFWKLLYDQNAGVFNWVLTALGGPRVAWLSLDMALPSAVIMDVWQTTPFFMLVLLAGLQTMDENLLGAARVDGAGAWQMFRFITLPHLIPYMLIAAAFRVIAAMGDFDKIYLLTGGGPGNRTTTMSIYAYMTGFSTFDMGRTSAIAWLFVLIVLTISTPLLWFLFRTARADRH
jgi:multiple sugar transport system permease protein/sorbitol/mannitol transport system permease protein